MGSKMPTSDALAILFTGITIVFIVLILLIIAVSLISYFFKKSNQNITPSAPAKKIVSAPVPTVKPALVVEDGISDDIVAVIAAAVAAMSSDSSNTTYAIRGIKKANIGRPVWATAGLQDNTRAF